MKKIFVLAIVSFLIISSMGICAETKSTVPQYDNTKDRLSKGMNNILYGTVEVPKNIDETKSKGTQLTGCTTKTRTGVERGIARVVGGLWQVATFWYSEPDAPASQSGSSASTK